MAEVDEPSSSPTPVVGWAWVCVALVPVGVFLSVVVLFGFASVLDVDLLPAQGSVQVSFATGLLLGTTSVLVALAAPTTAVVLSVRALRAGERSGKTARDVSALALVLAALGFTLGVGTFGLLGILVVGVVLFVELRRPRSE